MPDMRRKALGESRKTTSRKAARRPESLANSPLPTSKAGSHSSSRLGSRQVSAVNSRAGSRYPSDDEGSSGLSHADLRRLQNMRFADGTAGQSVLASTRSQHNDDDDNDDDSDLGEEGDSSASDSEDSLADIDPEELLKSASIFDQAFRDVMESLQDRKRSNLSGRTKALAKLCRLLRSIYSDDSVSEALPALLTQLLKGIRKSSSSTEDNQERKLAIEGLTLTALSCADASDGAEVFERSFSAVKQLIQDPDATEACKAVALQALAVVVVVGSGLQSTLDELLNFLLGIVESDGESASAYDSAAVVTAAIQAWSFASSFTTNALESLSSSMEEGRNPNNGRDFDLAHDSSDKNDETAAKKGNAEQAEPERVRSSEDKGDTDADVASDYDTDNEGADEEGHFASQSQRSLEAFIDQLESTSVDVQVNAGISIALLYETSRKYEEVLGRPLRLQKSPVELARQMKLLGQGSARSVKSTGRHVRRQLREGFRDVAASLEAGAGPGVKTTNAPTVPKTTGINPDDGDCDYAALSGDLDPNYDTDSHLGTVEAFGRQKAINLGDHSMAIDTWAKSVRVDMLRTILGSGMPVHLTSNPTVRSILEAHRLQRRHHEATKDRKKTFKSGRKARKGKMDEEAWRRERRETMR